MDLCRFCRARLSEFLDGQLSPSEREKVAAHLQTCAGCARALGELEDEARIARAALRELVPVPAPADLRLKVRAALQNEAARRQPFWGFNFRSERARSSDSTASGRWNGAKLVWTGSLTLAALVLMLLARPYSTAPLSPSAPQPSHEAQSARAPAPLSIAPPRATPKAVPKPAKKAPRPTVSSRSAAPEVETTAPPRPAPSRPAPSRQMARDQAAPRQATSNVAPVATPAPRRAAVAREPEEREPQKPAPSPIFRAPSFPPRLTQKAVPPPQMAPLPSPRQKIAPISPSPSAVSPPPADIRSRSRLTAPSAAPRTPETPTAPRFLVALSAIASSEGEGVRPSMAAKAESALARDEARENAAAEPQAVAPFAAPPPAPEAGREETADRAPAMSDAPSRFAPSRAMRSADAIPLAAPPARSFQLKVSATRALQSAQIRLILPPQLRFSASDASESRVVWRGDFAANAPVAVPFSLHGARGGEIISLLVEQNEAGGKSKVVETQTLTLPTAN